MTQDDEQHAMERVIDLAATKLARSMRGIVADRVYPPNDAAELLGMGSARGGKTLREVPEQLLPVTPVLPSGRKVGYLGSDLLAYLNGQRAARIKRKAG